MALPVLTLLADSSYSCFQMLEQTSLQHCLALTISPSSPSVHSISCVSCVVARFAYTACKHLINMWLNLHAQLLARMESILIDWEDDVTASESLLSFVERFLPSALQQFVDFASSLRIHPGAASDASHSWHHPLQAVKSWSNMCIEAQTEQSYTYL